MPPHKNYAVIAPYRSPSLYVCVVGRQKANDISHRWILIITIWGIFEHKLNLGLRDRGAQWAHITSPQSAQRIKGLGNEISVSLLDRIAEEFQIYYDGTSTFAKTERSQRTKFCRRENFGTAIKRKSSYPSITQQSTSCWLFAG
ncbi:hypothetical protein [Sulfitobacter sp.]|uniref:hypothetical protein n=1 Tax=Sulfitobacter sp. TaxID=1903071 RepID=UPI003EF3A05C